MSKKARMTAKVGMVALALLLSIAKPVSAEEFQLRRFHITDLQNVFGDDSSKLINHILNDVNISVVDEYMLQKQLKPRDTNGDKITINGTFNFKEKRIRINDELDEYKQCRVLYHELGHYIDDILHLSSTAEFKRIFEENEKDKASKLSDEYYFRDDIEEYWAESFAIIANRPEEAKRKMPDTYYYITEKVNEFTSGFNTAIKGKTIVANDETGNFIAGFKCGYAVKDKYMNEEVKQ